MSYFPRPDQRQKQYWIIMRVKSRRVVVCVHLQSFRHLTYLFSNRKKAQHTLPPSSARRKVSEDVCGHDVSGLACLHRHGLASKREYRPFATPCRDLLKAPSARRRYTSDEEAAICLRGKLFQDFTRALSLAVDPFSSELQTVHRPPVCPPSLQQPPVRSVTL